MNTETVDLLLNLLTKASRTATENQDKITALESALETQEALHAAYSKKLEELKRRRDFGKLAIAVEALRTRLLQE
jgi:hypothetical protein